uniref:G_PROTEIN_RECEP_F1_2 domain-containing protein n=1 Tax=Caenorhabditis tropicalis TaxID=1561998 RepID=A0A1I7SYR1_9PELO
MNDSALLVPPKWPMLVYYGMSIVSLPLYFLVFVSFLRLRCVSKTYNSTFYTILLQHSIADLLAMMFFFATNPMRVLPFIREIYFNYQHYYITAASYNSIYYFLYVRCTGIVFLSLQRYYIICCPTYRLTFKVQNTSNWKIVITYWLVPTLISAVVLKDTNFSYDTFERMAIVADQDVIQTGPIFYMRALYPVANGLLSYINPFCILFLNKDLARQVFRSVICHKPKVSDVQMSGIATTSTKHPNKKDNNFIGHPNDNHTSEVVI